MVELRRQRQNPIHANMATTTVDKTENAATAASGSIYAPAIANRSVGR